MKSKILFGPGARIFKKNIMAIQSVYQFNLSTLIKHNSFENIPQIMLSGGVRGAAGTASTEALLNVEWIIGNFHLL